MKTEQIRRGLSQLCLRLKDIETQELAAYCEALIAEHKKGTYDDVISDLEIQRKNHRYLSKSDDDRVFQQAIDQVVKIALSQHIASQR
ncbi:hypothetical protein [Lacticaseibacillus mingshuiensis]|uniref:hypothetical protein n=1 Tax=Lacticaseibacillus mingshuiensis TaxID=2799574 RepID=UPI0019522241|nr:hypothetical protein [Lacticaseibacillus mingshuiensis]